MLLFIGQNLVEIVCLFIFLRCGPVDLNELQLSTLLNKVPKKALI